jgi:hypothetical protein
LKGIPAIQYWGRDLAHSIRYNELEAWQVFFITLMEEHKSIYSGLRITGMALSNQSELPAFFSSRQVNL